MKRPRLIRGPIRPDRWTALRFVTLRWAALPVIDRRWTAPLSALALGFGLFVGVAIGPAAEGSAGEGATQTVIAVVQPPEAPAPADTGGPPNGGQGDDKPDHTPAEPTQTPSPPTDNGPFGETPPSTPSIPPTTTPQAPPPTTTTTTTTPTDTDDGDDQPQGPPVVKGSVAHVNELAASYTVARADGTLVAVHADELPTIGAVVQVEAHALANGTRGETGERSRTDRTEQVELSGTVTFSDPRLGAYTLSATGTSVLIRVPAGERMPTVGDQADVTARIADNLDSIEAVEPGRDGCDTPPKIALEQQGLETTGSATSTNLEGIVEGVCRKAGTLILSADDLRASGHDIAISVPSNLSLGDISPGQVLAIRASLGSSGHLTATRIADDEGEAAANDADRIQP
jgi:hypothetical protein